MTTPSATETRHVNLSERLAGRSSCAAGFNLEIPASADGKPPEWLHIFPNPDADGIARARDGRKFRFPPGGLREVVDATNAEISELGPGPVDLNHQLYGWSSREEDGEAVGWMSRVELRGDGVWAKWDPLPKGAEKATSGAWRYTSSVLAVDVKWIRDEDGWPVDLVMTAKTIEGFALTNTPAMRVKSFLARDGRDQENPMMDATIKVVLERLGLGDDAKPEAVRQAFEKLAKPGDPALADFVPRSEHDRVKESLAKAEAQLAEERETKAAEKRDEALKRAIDEGKILPSNRAYFERQLKRDGGLEDFEEFLASAPKIAAAERASATPRTKVDPAKVPAGVDPRAVELADEGKQPHEIAETLRRERSTKKE